MGGGEEPSLYLGLDASTQSLTAVAIDVSGDDARVVLETALAFDEAFPHYGTTHGVLPRTDPAVAESPPAMWAEALDVLMQRLSQSGLDLRRLAAISGSAQQHGSVYLNAQAEAALTGLDPAQPLAAQMAPMLSRATAPIWMDSSTAPQCAEITAAVGGQRVLSRHTGSRAFERFTGPQIRKFFTDDPAGYASTGRIHLVSSFLASLLTGRHAPLEPGDASGMNLMDLASAHWWPAAVDATAPDLARRLPAIVPSWMDAGSLSRFWQVRHRLPPARVIVWSGDNPCSLVGVGLVREGRVAISLGTSDTVFGVMKEPRVDPGGTGHVFGAPTGDYLGLTCFSNGSLARERVRQDHGLTWSDVSRVLDTTPPGNGGRVLLPWFEPEITPAVARAGVHRYGLSPEDAPGNVRAVIEAQQMAMALHSRWMNVAIDRIQATGGAAVNSQILQVMADVFGVAVHRSEVTSSAALGAALRAWHGDRLAEGRPMAWDDIVGAIAAASTQTRLSPDARRHAIYRQLIPVYAACEAHALGRGPAPALQA